MHQAVGLGGGPLPGLLGLVFRRRLFRLIGVLGLCFMRSRLIRVCRSRCRRSGKRFSRFECGPKCNGRPENPLDDIPSKRTFREKLVPQPVIKSDRLPGVRDVNRVESGSLRGQSSNPVFFICNHRLKPCHIAGVMIPSFFKLLAQVGQTLFLLL